MLKGSLKLSVKWKCVVTKFESVLSALNELASYASTGHGKCLVLNVFLCCHCKD